MGGKAADEQHFLAGFGMGADHRVLGIGILRLQRMALFFGHPRAEGRLDRVPRLEAVDRRLDVIGQVGIGLGHVRPHRIAADRRAGDAAQHRAHWRVVAPGCIAVPSVFEVVGRRILVLVDLHQTGIFGIAADHRMVFKRPEALGKGDVIGARDVLIAQEQHLVLEQLGADRAEQIVAAARLRPG